MKKTAILATAVAAIMAGTAVADTTVYGRARLALQMADNATGVVNGSSRFGFKGSEDLGNGMAAIYHFELGYAADDNTGSDDVDNRIGMVGLKGDFGAFMMGRMWVPTYNMVESMQDVFNIPGSGNDYDLGSRASDALAYANSFGDVQLQVAIVSDSSTDDLNDALNAAIQLPAGPVTVGVGMVDITDVDSGTIVSVKFDADAFSIVGTLSSAEDIGGDNVTTILASAKLGSGMAHIRLNNMDNADASYITAGYHQNLSKRTQAFVEMETEDNGAGGVGGEGAQWVGLKHNF
jgi:predicted porin